MARRLVYSAVPVALLLLGAELLLLALGLGQRQVDVARGFDPRASYIVPDPDVAGGFRTRMFDGRKPEVAIAARSASDGRVRVCLFGGSNTEAFPHNPLQWLLNHEGPPGGPGYEVVKLGREGYGSERVRLLFEQALAQLAPDVALVYSGHNEFIERGFRADLDAAWSPAASGVAGALGHLRSFNALVAAFGPPAPRDPVAVPPERWQWEYDKFADFTYAETLAQLERYRANLERMCQLAGERGVALVLCTVVGNALTAPFSSVLAPELSPADRAACEAALASGVAAIPERFRALVPAPGGRLLVSDWNRPERAARAAADIAPAPPLRALSGPFDAAHRAGRGWWPDPALWSARVPPVLATLSAFHARALTAAERASLIAAQAHLESALERAPDHPLARFRLGTVQALLGDDAAAADSLDAAAACDRAPRRGSDVTNGIVRGLAARYAHVTLFDVEALVRARTPAGIVGFELMKDECHFHDAVLPVLMRDFAGALLALERKRGDG